MGSSPSSRRVCSLGNPKLESRVRENDGTSRRAREATGFRDSSSPLSPKRDIKVIKGDLESPESREDAPRPSTPRYLDDARFNLGTRFAAVITYARRDDVWAEEKWESRGVLVERKHLPRDPLSIYAATF